jgi:hypothetical protein
MVHHDNMTLWFTEDAASIMASATPAAAGLLGHLPTAFSSE